MNANNICAQLNAIGFHYGGKRPVASDNGTILIGQHRIWIADDTVSSTDLPTVAQDIAARLGLAFHSDTTTTAVHVDDVGTPTEPPDDDG